MWFFRTIFELKFHQRKSIFSRHDKSVAPERSTKIPWIIRKKFTLQIFVKRVHMLIFFTLLFWTNILFFIKKIQKYWHKNRYFKNELMCMLLMSFLRAELLKSVYIICVHFSRVQFLIFDSTVSLVSQSAFVFLLFDFAVSLAKQCFCTFEVYNWKMCIQSWVK